MSKKKTIALFLAGIGAVVATAIALLGFGAIPTTTTDGTGATSVPANAFRVTMVTDTAGVSDKSFNQLCWEGLLKFKVQTDSYCSYLQPSSDDYLEQNLRKAAEIGSDLVWGNGYNMADAISAAAKAYPDTTFALIDGTFDDAPSNLVGVSFRAQEPSFVVGYIAAKTTTTNKVGFVGGMRSSIVDQFEWGFKAGVAYGAKEDGKKVEVVDVYLDSFTDTAKGKSTGAQMYADGCDIVFHAAGSAGTGVISAAVDAGKLVIGVDRDQSDLAPNNVLTSALKRVDKAVLQVSYDVRSGARTSGNIDLGLAEDCVGIPDGHSLMDETVYDSAVALEARIKDGNIVPPANESGYWEYVSELTAR
ncbi:MAG: BMP family ABC transporter substrate-binding protein [Atopobiaceae bacterium]|jgi:basic membrane protein A|nr:BMP family ABC transporter substrate-binding protein [Atopobiaceae bacterium]